MNFSKMISENAKYLTRSEQEALQKLFTYRDELNYHHFTITQIAEQLNISSTTLHRMVKKLGFSSFTIFKESYFSKDYFDDNYEITNSEYINGIYYTYHQIESTINDELIDKINQASRVIFYSMGMNAYIAKMFQIKFALAGFHVEQYDDSRYMRVSSRYLQGDEFIIVLSRSGNPPELVEAMLDVNAKQVFSLLITENTASPLSSLATKTILIPKSQDSDINIDTRINYHVALDCLANHIFSRERTNNE
ncbi:MurR/RpiR family transcriptional regulator [Vagococcus humatus]|uniref:MurR/RpiR family transcriptional regulator n=1 Tax=Vagococcus humatus TaxID=1889241 RepID=A0A3S0ACY5_9ENTE|nr:MurR/RpiR family transcriptional regulator [Vagococcus humatus]RST88880.1 MurR/RpiR family transcriptional regulator [Vagococcus humatus]